MSQVELMYQRHLDRLREMAKEEGTRFVDILSLFSEAYKRPGLARSVSKSAGFEQIKATEKLLIDEYRPQFYESTANKSLGETEAIIKAAINDAINLHKKYERAR